MSVLPFYPIYPKDYGHTISREVEDIKIEPVAWNSDKQSGHPINAVGSTNNISQQSGTVKESGTSVLQRVEALTRNGEKITVDEAKAASGYGDYGAKVLTNFVNNAKGQSFSQVKSDMHNYYLAGASNKKGVTLNTDLQREAYYAGKKDRAMSKVTAQENITSNKVFEKGGLITPDTYKGTVNGMKPISVPDSVSPAMAKAYGMVGKHFGRKVIFVDNLYAYNEKGEIVGEADAQVDNNGVFAVSANADKPHYKLIAHEPLHIMRQENTEAYHTFIDFALQNAELLDIRLEQGNSVGTTYDNLQRVYTSKGLNLEFEKTIDEIGARFSEKLFQNDQDAIDFINKMNEREDTRNALQKFMDAVKRVIAKLKEVVASLKKDGEHLAAKEVENTIFDLERARELYAKAYKATQKAVENRVAEQKTSAKTETKTQKNAGKDGGVDFLLKENIGKDKQFNTRNRFYSQLDSWDGETTGFSFVLGTTSKALLEAKVPNKQIRWDASKIKSLLNKHNGMTIETVRQIPNLLENPVVVIDSKKNSNARIVMGDLYDANGKLVTVVLLLTPTSKKGNQLDVIKVSSAQGRSHIESLFRKDDGSRIKVRFVDEKRIQSWLNVNRLQLPLRSFNLDSNNTISQTTENSQENFTGREATANRQFSLKDDVDKAYTDQEYQDYGWARENGILTADQNADYRTKFAMAKSGQVKFPKSKKGEYIIPVSDIYDSDKEGINNVLVFAKGTIDKPVITSIIEIYEYDETSLDRTRRYIYDRERRGIQPQAGELFERYFAFDFRVRNQQRKVLQSDGDSSDNGYGRRSGGEASKTERGIGEEDFSLKDDVEVSPKKTKELLDTIAYLKDQMKLTKFAKPDPKKLKTMTRKLLKDYGSKIDLDETTPALEDLYRYIANGQDGHPAAWDEVYSKAKEIATSVVEGAVMTDDSDWVTYKELRDYSG